MAVALNPQNAYFKSYSSSTHCVIFVDVICTSSSANSRIDSICLQQTNLASNFGRQGLSAFCTILATRASAFLIRFVKNKSRQTLSADLSADLSAISKV